MKSFVLDLRNNRFGLAETGLCYTSFFGNLNIVMFHAAVAFFPKESKLQRFGKLVHLVFSSISCLPTLLFLVPDFPSYIEASICCSWFVRMDKGVIVYICDSQGVRDIYEADGISTVAASEPLVVLVCSVTAQLDNGR